MMIAVWPDTVPSRPRQSGAFGGPVDFRAVFDPEVGPPIPRRRTTAEVERFEVPLQPITLAEYTAFKAWFQGDAAQGARAFLWRHPVTREVARWQFAAQDPMIRVERASLSRFYLTFQATRLPGVPWFAPYVPDDVLRVPAVVADYANDVFGVDGERTVASSVAAVAGTYDVWTYPVSGTVTIETSHAVAAGDIPATAPAGVSKIVAFIP